MSAHWAAFSARQRSETSLDQASVSFYLHCSLDVNKDRMTLWSGRVVFLNATLNVIILSLSFITYKQG